MLTRFGFTTVVDTASDLEDTLALRRRIETGDVLGPRILTAGGALYPPDGVPFYVREQVAGQVLSRLHQPAAPEAARATVSRQAEQGADIVKIFAGSWVSRGKVLPMPEEIARAAVAEAHIIANSSSRIRRTSLDWRSHCDPASTFSHTRSTTHAA